MIQGLLARMIVFAMATILPDGVPAARRPDVLRRDRHHRLAPAPQRGVAARCGVGDPRARRCDPVRVVRWGGLAGSTLVAAAAYLGGSPFVRGTTVTLGTMLAGRQGVLLPLCWVLGLTALVC